MLLLCYYNSAKFSLKNKAMSLAIAEKKNYLAQFSNDLNSLLVCGNYTLSYTRTSFYVIVFIFLYCLKLYTHKM